MNGSSLGLPAFVGVLDQEQHELASGDRLGPARQPELGFRRQSPFERNLAADVSGRLPLAAPIARSAILGRRAQPWFDPPRLNKTVALLRRFRRRGTPAPSPSLVANGQPPNSDPKP
jgi:hypothetical protein